MVQFILIIVGIPVVLAFIAAILAIAVEIADRLSRPM